MLKEAAALAECSSESTELHRQTVRSQLDQDINHFLQGGGRVQQIDNNVRADPPRRPSMTYGSTPI